MKIIMEVNHGQTKVEIANGDSFEQCLAILSDTPLYIGYGPNLPKMETLKVDKKFSYGWADYTFINDEEIKDLLK